MAAVPAPAPAIDVSGGADPTKADTPEEVSAVLAQLAGLRDGRLPAVPAGGLPLLLAVRLLLLATSTAMTMTAASRSSRRAPGTCWSKRSSTRRAAGFVARRTDRPSGVRRTT